MPITVPTTLSDTALAESMHLTLGSTADALGWSVLASSYTRPIIRTLMRYGVSQIADVGTGLEDIEKLYALGDVEAWDAAADALVSRVDVRLDGQEIKWSQMLAGARASLARAEARAAKYGGAANVAIISTIRRINDPYDSALSDTERVW